MFSTYAAGPGDFAAGPGKQNTRPQPIPKRGFLTNLTVA